MIIQTKYLDSAITQLKQTFSQYEKNHVDKEQYGVVSNEVRDTMANYQAWIACGMSLNADEITQNVIDKVNVTLKSHLQVLETNLLSIYSLQVDSILKELPEIYSWSSDIDGIKGKLRKSVKKHLEDELSSSAVFSDEVCAEILENSSQIIRQRLQELATISLGNLISKSEKEFSKLVLEEKTAISSLLNTLVSEAAEQGSLPSSPVSPVQTATGHGAFAGRNAALMANLNRMLSQPAVETLDTLQNNENSVPGSIPRVPVKSDVKQNASESDREEKVERLEDTAEPPEIPLKEDVGQVQEIKQPIAQTSKKSSKQLPQQSGSSASLGEEKSKKSGFKSFFGLSKSKSKKKDQQPSESDSQNASVENLNKSAEKIPSQNASSHSLAQEAPQDTSFASLQQEQVTTEFVTEAQTVSEASQPTVSTPPKARKLPPVPPRRDLVNPVHDSTDDELKPVLIEAPKPMPRVPVPNIAVHRKSNTTADSPLSAHEQSSPLKSSFTETVPQPAEESKYIRKPPAGSIPLMGHGAISALAMAVTGRSAPPPKPTKPKNLEHIRQEHELALENDSMSPLDVSHSPTSAVSESVEVDKSEICDSSDPVSSVRLVHSNDFAMLSEPLSIKKKENSTSGDDKAIERNALDWINYNLKESDIQVQDLFVELDDGLKLILALEKCSGESVGKYNKRIMLPVHKIDNIAVALRFLRKKGVPTDFVTPQDIFNHDRGKILTLFTYVLRQFPI